MTQQTIKDLIIARAIFQQKAVVEVINQKKWDDGYNETMKRYSGDFSDESARGES